MPEIIIPAFIVFAFGTIVGSFLNVLALRYNTGRALAGRSSCSSCSHQLLWFELIPVFSFFMLRGRCRSCGSLLSIQYPVVEFLTGLLFVGLFLKGFSVVYFLYFAAILSIYVVIGVYDIRHTIVPDGLSLSVALLALIGLFFNLNTLSFALPSIGLLFSGPLIALPLFLLWLFSRGMWMGLGDAKLSLSIGWLLGISLGFTALLTAFWTGALFGLSVIFISYLRKSLARLSSGKSRLFLLVGERTMKSEIPFAPFLLLGFAFAFFFEIDILQIIGSAL